MAENHALSLATILVVFGPMPVIMALALAGFLRHRRSRR